MSSPELYERLLSSACVNGPPQQSTFAYELTTVSPALFHCDSTMHKSQKSLLARHLLQMNKDITCQKSEGPAANVYDGCALFHQLPWPNIELMTSVFETFVSFIDHKRAAEMLSWVIFDSYDAIITKDPEQDIGSQSKQKPQTC